METVISMYEKQMDDLSKLHTLEKVSGQSVDSLISLFSEDCISKVSVTYGNMMREYLDNNYPYTVDDVVKYTEKLVRDALSELLEGK